jgi:hypothetical protein
MVKTDMRKWSTSLTINKLKLRNILKFYFTSVRMASIKNTTNNKW